MAIITAKVRAARDAEPKFTPSGAAILDPEPTTKENQ